MSDQQVSAPATPTPQAPAQGQEAQSMPATAPKNSVPSAPKVTSEPSQPSQPEIYDVKVNGKIVKMTRQEVLDHASMSHTANSKFDEAAKTRKQVEKIIETAKKNPIEALMDPTLGLTKEQIRDAFEAWYTREYIDPEKLTPEQRRHKELEAELKHYKEQEIEKKKKEEEEHLEKLTQHQKQYLQNQIVEAMEKSGLPKTEFFASRMAFYMRENFMKGWDAPIDLIVSQVKKERQAMMSDFTQNSSAEQLIGLLGEDVINKIRQHDLTQLRARRQVGAPQLTHSSSGSSNQGERVSSAEVTRRLREMRLGRR